MKTQPKKKKKPYKEFGDKVVPVIDSNKDVICVYTDGSAMNNGFGGPGTWAYVIVEGDKLLHEKSSWVESTTNNRMEATSAIEALLFIQREVAKDIQVILYTDSSYVYNTCTKWIHGWHSNNYKRGQDMVPNHDLWQQLYPLIIELTNVQYVWVKGHQQEGTSTHGKWNNHTDRLCTQAYDKIEPTPIGNTPDNLEYMCRKELPVAAINHIDGNPNNNEPANLEVVNAKVNSSVPLKAAKAKKEKIGREFLKTLVTDVQEIQNGKTEADKLLLEVYELALTDGDPIPTLLKITKYLTNAKLI